MSGARRLAFALVAITAAGCDGCGGRIRTPDAGSRSARAPAPSPGVEADPSTPQGRLALHLAQTPEEREKVERRAMLLSDGRRLARAGEHERALFALRDGLEGLGGPDAALECAAAEAAIRSGHWDLAREHVRSGTSAAVQPRERAACLYQRSLLAEHDGDRNRAVAALEAALTLRRNATVERRLEALQSAEEPESEERRPEPEGGDDTDGLAARAAGPHESLAAFCAAVVCDSDSDSDLAPPGTWSGVQSLALVRFRESEGAPLEHTWLFAREGDEWRGVAPLARSDRRSVPGVPEARERIADVQVAEGLLSVRVVGTFDEHEDELAAWLDCATSQPGDQAGARTCFDERIASLPPPESWSRTLTFGFEGGAIAVVEQATQATQTR